ncbi:MAG: hypothetical protein ISS29_09120, partial [Candidatus Marinimicrobia bacterium]|nr:hypothetical protein [Candidatus Neomarinimicrobiota bacterium]
MKSFRNTILIILALCFSVQNGSSQDIEDLKAKILSGKLSPEEAVKKSEELQILSETSKTGVPIKKTESLKPIYLKDYLFEKSQIVEDLQQTGYVDTIITT